MSIQLEHSHNRAATPSHLHSTCLSPLHCHLIRHPDFTSPDSMAVTHPRPIKWQLEYLNQCSYMPVGDTCHYPTSILLVHCHEHSCTPFTSIVHVTLDGQSNQSPVVGNCILIHLALCL